MENVFYEAALKTLTDELEKAQDSAQVERLTNAIAFLKKENGVEEAPASDATE